MHQNVEGRSLPAFEMPRTHSFCTLLDQLRSSRVSEQSKKRRGCFLCLCFYGRLASAGFHFSLLQREPRETSYFNSAPGRRRRVQRGRDSSFRRIFRVRQFFSCSCCGRNRSNARQSDATNWTSCKTQTACDHNACTETQSTAFVISASTVNANGSLDSLKTTASQALKVYHQAIAQLCPPTWRHQGSAARSFQLLQLQDHSKVQHSHAHRRHQKFRH